MDLSKYPTDILFRLALDLDLPTLLSYCQANSKFNNASCGNKYFWIQKLKNDFDITWKDLGHSPKEDYEYVYISTTMIFENSIDLAPKATQFFDMKGYKNTFFKDVKNFGRYYGKILDDKESQLAILDLEYIVNQYHISEMGIMQIFQFQLSNN